jgi:hypothetical protein
MKKISLILAGILFSCTLQAVNDESNIGKGVESDQIQMRKRSNGVIKKSIEKTGEEILIKEYDQQGNLIKITEKACPDCKALEFTFKDGKIISAKDEFDFGTTPVIDKQKNIVTIVHNSEFSTFEFNEFGIKKYSISYIDYKISRSYEYNEEGLLVKKVEISQDFVEESSTQTTSTYTYDVMNQNWKKRTETDDRGYETVTTRTVEYW